MERPPAFNLVVRALYFREGALLVSRWRGSYCFPVGGRIEPGESLEQAVCREFEEETGAKARLLRLVYFHENFFGHGSSDGVHELGWYFWAEADQTIGRPGSSAPHPDAETLTLEYVPLDSLGSVDLRPPFLADHLPADFAAGFSAAPRHLLTRSQDGSSVTREIVWKGSRR
ncbi:MAG: NUDIX hydrolase [Anaerolineales bacterium]